MTSPIVVTAIFHPAPHAFDQVVEALKPAIAAVHQEPGCVLYSIHKAEDGSIVMIEKWDSVELLDAHGEGPAVAALIESLEGLLAAPLSVTRMWPIAAGTEAQGQL